ncbi:MAG: flagellar biosynthesis anti-sigma factor FlgM [Planctomycetota bacterium]|jgi:anti-sigma28 factor (negative regulator of flagellin synthesis)|nr:flagellar biosynthesis anti-sigma factor FlgM [Planctomycetota bacterium]
MVDNVNAVGGAGMASPARKGGKAVYRVETAVADSVEISSNIMRLTGIEGVRMEKVIQVRQKIASGEYFTREKLEIALDRALDEI